MIEKGIIVSIQEYSTSTTQELVRAAIKGGAVAIRTNRPIYSDVPIIALEKIPGKKYYITTTKQAIQYCSFGQYVAIDSRCGNQDLDLLLAFCHINEYSIAADIENIGDVKNIINICQSKKIEMPKYLSTTFSFMETMKHDFQLIKEIKKIIDIPVIAEGKIKTIEDVKKAFDFGANNVCVGSEISDIKYLTKKFTEVI